MTEVAGDERVTVIPDEPQRISVSCDLVPGPLAATVAERLLSIMVDELCQSGIVVTAIRIELQGWSTAW